MTAWRSQIDNDIVHSTIATRYPNGSDELRAHLAPIHDPRDPAKTVGYLVPTAAAAWDAMAAHALHDGVLLLPSSSADTFRPLRTQQAIFADRYRTTNQGNGSRVCNGKKWYLRKGKATAACPGTSNHGRGEAIDVGNCTGSRLAWLETHARTYGFAWELASEPWHLHYMLGDRLPAGITTTPGHAPAPAPDPDEEDDMRPRTIHATAPAFTPVDDDAAPPPFPINLPPWDRAADYNFRRCVVSLAHDPGKRPNADDAQPMDVRVAFLTDSGAVLEIHDNVTDVDTGKHRGLNGGKTLDAPKGTRVVSIQNSTPDAIGVCVELFPA